MQDGIDFITALATHPDTAPRLARKLWNYFISEDSRPTRRSSTAPRASICGTTPSIRAVVAFILKSPWFMDPGQWSRGIPGRSEFVTRAVKEVGWSGYSVDTSRVPLIAMGQVLFEPPDVAGWELGEGWFSTGTMLSRMNFASSLALNQKFNLARAVIADARTRRTTCSEYARSRVASAVRRPAGAELMAYMLAGGAWTGTDAQLQTKSAGLTRLIVGRPNIRLRVGRENDMAVTRRDFIRGGVAAFTSASPRRHS